MPWSTNCRQHYWRIAATPRVAVRVATAVALFNLFACNASDGLGPKISPDQLAGNYTFTLAGAETELWVRGYMYCATMETTLPGSTAHCPTGVIHLDGAVTRGGGDTLVVTGISDVNQTEIPSYHMYNWRGDASSGSATFQCSGSQFCAFKPSGKMTYVRH